MRIKDDFDIYVGGKSGVFKGVKLRKTGPVVQNIQNLVSITDHDEVSTISWGDNEEKEVLIACGVKGTRSIKVYDTEYSTFTCSFFCNVGTGKISGISRYNEAILTAVQSGEIKLWRFEEDNGILIQAGENLDRMQHSRINKNIIATGGNEHCLKLFDLERRQQIFIEKNLSHDWLQLRVPIWISDINFLPKTEQIVTVGRYGHVRLYDPKVQRRPVINLEMKDEALTTLAITPREKQIIVGSGKGRMNLVDLRKPTKILNLYKGFVGGVTGVACTNEPYVASVSLDRHLRIHHIDTKKLLKKVYLTSKMSCLLLRSGFSLPKENDEENIEKENMGRYTENGELENTQTVPESDEEYDRLFDKMQVVNSKEDKRFVTNKRKKVKTDRLLDSEEIVSDSSPLNKDKSNRSRKKMKSHSSQCL